MSFTHPSHEDSTVLYGVRHFDSGTPRTPRLWNWHIKLPDHEDIHFQVPSTRNENPSMNVREHSILTAGPYLVNPVVVKPGYLFELGEHIPLFSGLSG